MAVKYFCDVCSDEVNKTGRVLRGLGDVVVEVMVRYRGTWNAGIVCPVCVTQVVIDGNDVSDDQSYAKETTTLPQRSWTSTLPFNGG